VPGFPNVPNRSAFGPTYENKRKVQDANKELGADVINLLMWQIAGASRVVAQATLIYDPVTDKITYQALAFDPKNELPSIAVVKNGVGDYTFTFAATYLNQQGTATPFLPRMARASVQQTAVYLANLAATTFLNNLDVQVQVRDAAATLIDRPVLLLVW